MKTKKFVLFESCIVGGTILALLLNMVFKADKADDNVVKVGMDYYGSMTFEGDDSFTDNVWLKMIKEKYGFECKVDYALSTAEYETKTNAVIASGNIPDMFSININEFSILNEANLIYDDLTDVFDKYASDALKEGMGWDPVLKAKSPFFKKWTVNGKLKALPEISETYDKSYVLYIRKDWLDQVGYDAPKTINDVERILRAFKKNNLGKGLGIAEDILFNTACSADFIFNAFDSYPTLFVDDGKGGVDFGFATESTKNAIQKMADWYSDGLIYQQFATTDADYLGSRAAAGEVGMLYGTMSIPLWKLDSCVSTIEGSDFICVPAPSNGTNKTKVGISSTGSTGYVVKKNYKHPERLVQMMNLFYDTMFGLDGDFERFNPFCEAYPFVVYPANKNFNRSHQVSQAITQDRTNPYFQTFDVNNKQDTHGLAYFDLNCEAQFYYRKVRDYFVNGMDSTGNNWAYTRIFYGYEDANGLTMANGNVGFDSAFSAIDYYAENDLIKMTMYDGVDTKTYAAARRTIETKVSQMMKTIIKGEQDISYFDTVIKQLRKGDMTTIINEINAELAKG